VSPLDVLEGGTLLHQKVLELRKANAEMLAEIARSIMNTQDTKRKLPRKFYLTLKGLRLLTLHATRRYLLSYPTLRERCYDLNKCSSANFHLDESLSSIQPSRRSPNAHPDVEMAASYINKQLKHATWDFMGKSMNKHSQH
jgi:hypothetical protein